MSLNDLEFAYAPVRNQVRDLREYLDPARIRRELSEIEKKLSDPALWSDPAASKPLMRDRKRLEALVHDDDELVRRTGDIETYIELAREGEETFFWTWRRVHQRIEGLRRRP